MDHQRSSVSPSSASIDFDRLRGRPHSTTSFPAVTVERPSRPSTQGDAEDIDGPNPSLSTGPSIHSRDAFAIQMAVPMSGTLSPTSLPVRTLLHPDDNLSPYHFNSNSHEAAFPNANPLLLDPYHILTQHRAELDPQRDDYSDEDLNRGWARLPPNLKLHEVILEHLLGTLEAGDALAQKPIRRHISKLSLVCSKWSRVLRPRLFRALSLSSLEHIHFLLDILQAQPDNWLAATITELSLRLRLSELGSHTSLESILLLFSRKLPSLQNLRHFPAPGVTETLGLHVLPNLRHYSNLNRLTLTRIKVLSFSLLAKLLGSLLRLEILECCEVDWVNRDAVERQPPRMAPFRHLREVFATYSATVQGGAPWTFLWLFSPMILGQSGSTSGGFDSNIDNHDIQLLLLLTQLVHRASDAHGMVYNYDYEQCRLTIQCCGDENSQRHVAASGYDTTFRPFINEVAPNRIFSTIRRVTVQLRTYHQIVNFGAEWQVVDATFAEHAIYLECFGIIINHAGSIPASRIQAYFPRLSMSRVVNVTYRLPSFIEYIPPELTAMIMERVLYSSDDTDRIGRRDLSSLSLVCREWSHVLRPRLFQYVALRSMKDALFLHHILRRAGNERLPTAVTTLVVSTKLDIRLERLLSWKLVSLQTFTMIYTPLPHSQVPNFSHHRNLRSVHLANICLRLSLLARRLGALPRLEVLGCHNVYLLDDSSRKTPPSPMTPLPHLRRISVNYQLQNEYIYNGPVSPWLYLQLFQHMTERHTSPSSINRDIEMLQLLATLINDIRGGNMVNLIYNFVYTGGDQLAFNCWDNETHPATLVLACTATLWLYASAPLNNICSAIRNITILLRYDMHILDFGAKWGVVDADLAEKAVRLHRFDVVIDPEDTGAEENLDKVQAHFPRLSRRGVMRARFEPGAIDELRAHSNCDPPSDVGTQRL